MEAQQSWGKYIYQKTDYTIQSTYIKQITPYRALTWHGQVQDAMNIHRVTDIRHTHMWKWSAIFFTCADPSSYAWPAQNQIKPSILSDERTTQSLSRSLATSFHPAVLKRFRCWITLLSQIRDLEALLRRFLVFSTQRFAVPWLDFRHIWYILDSLFC